MELTNAEDIKRLLIRHGFRFSKSMGQNFLIDPTVPERIADAAGLDEGWGVLEIGPGIGCLTAELSERAGRVTAVELDASLKPLLAETLSGRDNVELVFGDALKTDLAALCRRAMPSLRYAVCANLPYNVTSPLLSAFIDAGCFESITVMIQREVARRLCAAPGTSEYGAFSVYVRWHCEAEMLFDVQPDCFMPQPKVTSTVLRLAMREAPPAWVRDEAHMFRLVRAAFNQRRKTLMNALKSGMPELSREQAEAAFTRCGIDLMARGETLSPELFAALSNALTEEA